MKYVIAENSEDKCIQYICQCKCNLAKQDYKVELTDYLSSAHKFDSLEEAEFAASLCEHVTAKRYEIRAIVRKPSVLVGQSYAYVEDGCILLTDRFGTLNLVHPLEEEDYERICNFLDQMQTDYKVQYVTCLKRVDRIKKQ